jgi:hypothetical protein
MCDRHLSCRAPNRPWRSSERSEQECLQWQRSLPSAPLPVRRYALYIGYFDQLCT